MESTPKTGAPAAGRDLLFAAALIAAGAVAVAALARFSLPVAAALCATGVAVAAAMAWPLAGLALFLGLIFIRPQDTFAELVPMRLALLVAGGSLFGWGMRLLSLRKWPRWSPPMTWMLVFVGAALASALPLPPSVVGERANELARILMILVLTTQLLRTPRQLQTFCGFLVAWSTWLAVVAIAGYYEGGALATTEGLRARGSGVFDDPNGTAIALVPAVPLAIAGVLNARNFLVRAAAALAAATMVWAIYLTNSRGGFLALAATLFVFAALRFGRRGLALGLLGCLAILALGPSRLEKTHDLDDSASDRITAWNVGLDLFRSRPVLGVGMETFQEYHELTAHNSFVLALAELGLVGTVCWVGLFVVVMRRGYRAGKAAGVPSIRNGRPQHPVGRGTALRDLVGIPGSPTMSGTPSVEHGTGGRSATLWSKVPGSVPGQAQRSPALHGGGAAPAGDGAADPSAATWPLINAAALAALAGFLVGGMFLSDTYSEIPFIYLGLSAAASGHLLAGREQRVKGMLARWLRSDLAIAGALTLLGIATVSVVVRIAR